MTNAYPDGPAVPRAWLARAQGLAKPGHRVILGIAGTPGAGKSSLAGALVAALGARAALVPMDGFHLAGQELARLGRADRKGAPDTFDADGYVALLDRLRWPERRETVYAPVFRRDLEEAVAGAIPIGPEIDLVITEGNYLLLEAEPWRRVRALLSECWYVEIDAASRLERLVARHCRFGRSESEARDWVLRSDEANARLVEGTRARADCLVHWPPAAHWDA